MSFQTENKDLNVETKKILNSPNDKNSREQIKDKNLAQQNKDRNQNESSKDENPRKEVNDLAQKQVVQEIAQLNILRQEMLKESQAFSNELDELQHQLIKKMNQLQVIASKQMAQISQININLVSQFVKYQEGLIKKLQSKHSDWDGIEHELNLLEAQFNQQMAKDDLPTKLATIGTLEYEIEHLVQEIEDLTQQNGNKRK